LRNNVKGRNMENELKKKVDLKNLKDMISENLRILEQKEQNTTLDNEKIQDNNSSHEGEKASIILPAYNRPPILEEDVDVINLDLKDESAGKKILKKGRKLLHGDIRHWVVLPLQKKQTDFNQKVTDNLNEIYSELDFNSARIDKNIRNIESYQNKIDSIPKELSTIEKKLEDTKTNVTKLESSKKDLENKLESTKTDVTKKLEASKKDLENKLESTKTNVTKLESSKKDLENKLESTKTDVAKKLEASNTELEKKLSDLNTVISSKNDSLVEKFENTLNQKISEIPAKHFTIEKSIEKKYAQILERPADKEGLDYFLNQIQTGTIQLDDFEKVVKNSEEYRTLNEGKKIVEKYRSLIKKPIFILGVPRTGTTLVYNILCSHKDLAWVSNNDIKDWLSPREQYDIESYFKWLKSKKKKIPVSEDSLFVFGKRLGKGLKQFGTLKKKTSKIPIEGEMLWRKFFGVDFIEDIPIYSKIAYVKEVSKILKQQSKPRFLSKAPQNSMRVFTLQKIFPDAKFINVTRNPFAVVCSMMQRHNEEGEFDMGMPVKNKTKYEGMNLLEKFAWRYYELSEFIHDFSKQTKADFITIRYDELIKNPKEMTKKILDFCELEEPKNINSLIPTLRKKTNEDWQKKLSKEEENKIFQIVEPILKKLNYPYKRKKIRKSKR